MLSRLKPAEIQVITDGSEPNTAKFVSAYILGAIQTYGLMQNGADSDNMHGIKAYSKDFWYNPSLKKHLFYTSRFSCNYYDNDRHSVDCPLLLRENGKEGQWRQY